MCIFLPYHCNVICLNGSAIHELSSRIRFPVLFKIPTIRGSKHSHVGH